MVSTGSGGDGRWQQQAHSQGPPAPFGPPVPPPPADWPPRGSPEWGRAVDARFQAQHGPPKAPPARFLGQDPAPGESPLLQPAPKAAAPPRPGEPMHVPLAGPGSVQFHAPAYGQGARQGYKGKGKGTHGRRPAGGLSAGSKFALPHWAVRAGDRRGDGSIMIVDTRDKRLISPHQGWVAYEISANSQEDPNTRTESRRVDRPSAGYYFSMFCCYTLKTFKIVVSINMETAKAYQAPQYSPEVLAVLAQEAFQPVSYPSIVSDETPLICDL